jgi:hypothetical protein
MHIIDALNRKQVDWPEIFRDKLISELKSIKEEVFKDKTTGMKSMIGPPLTMLLIAEGLLIVPQEIEVDILMPADLIEKPIFKKRKIGPSMELTPGQPSKSKKVPQICVAMATPTIAKPKIISNINI